jgi:hypothetical protein
MKTIRKWFLLAFTICSILPTNAQSIRFFAGAKAGFGIPNLTAGSLTTPLSVGYSSRLGFYGGLITEIQTESRFGIRAEINYSSQGGKRDGLQALPLSADLEQLWQMLPQFGITPDKYMYADIKSEAILNYLEIPVMAIYTFNLGSRFNFYLQAGPYLGLMLNSKNVTSGNSRIYVDKEGTIAVDDILQQAGMQPIGEQSFDHTENVTSDIRRVNVGGQGAVGFGLNVGSGKFFVEGGGNYGFIPVQKNDTNGNNDTGAGTVTVGYLFQLK